MLLLGKMLSVLEITYICLFKATLKSLPNDHYPAGLGPLAACTSSTCRMLNILCSCSPDNSHKPSCQTALAKTSSAQQSSAKTIDLMGASDTPYIDLSLAEVQKCSAISQRQLGLCSKQMVFTFGRGSIQEKEEMRRGQSLLQVSGQATHQESWKGNFRKVKAAMTTCLYCRAELPRIHVSCLRTMAPLPCSESSPVLFGRGHPDVPSSQRRISH